VIFSTREHGVDVTTKIFSSAKPQHMRTAYLDPTIGQGQDLTVYTGELEIGHGAGKDRTGYTIEYPILGLFVDTDNNLILGIISIGGSNNNIDNNRTFFIAQ
jgi:hypothetical protein